MKSLVPWLLAAGAGVALALALPGPNLAPLILVFPGLLLEALSRGTGRWRPWLIGLVAGTVHWVVATNWVVPVMHHYGGLPLAVAVLCVVGMGLLLGLCWSLTAGLTSLVPASLRVWAMPCIFITIDACRQFWPYRFPWNPPAAAFARWPELLQSLPVWGATGLGWAAITIGAALWGVTRNDRRLGAVAAMVTAGVLIAVCGVAAPPATFKGDTVRVGVIQPGTSLEEKWDPAEWRTIEDKVWRLTTGAAREGAEILLWPESALPYRIEDDPAFRSALENRARGHGMAIVLNGVGRSAGGGYTNSVYVVRPDGMAPERYDKVRLVPFGEFVPWWASMAFTESLVREVGHFEPGPEPVLLDAGIRIGMAICYEVVFADLIAEEVREGAELLATVTNDGWYGYSWAPHQHFAQVVLRAAESRRWFARAALTGISGFVDPLGRVRARLELGEEGLLVQDLRPSTALTPRSRWGDWWCGVCAVVSIVMLAVSWQRRRRSV